MKINFKIAAIAVSFVAFILACVMMIGVVNDKPETVRWEKFFDVVTIDMVTVNFRVICSYETAGTPQLGMMEFKHNVRNILAEYKYNEIPKKLRPVLRTALDQAKTHSITIDSISYSIP